MCVCACVHAPVQMGIAGGTESLLLMRLAGLSAWIAGALSMGLGEYISVASQLDAEAADVEKVQAGGSAAGQGAGGGWSRRDGGPGDREGAADGVAAEFLGRQGGETGGGVWGQACRCRHTRV